MRLLLITFFLSSMCMAQIPKNEIQLVVQADDIGFCHAVNRACIDVYKTGVARSVEVIVPSPWFMEAAKMLKENPGYDVGVHLCLTSEWSNLKWRPMTPATSLRNPDGYFCPFIWVNDNWEKNAGNFLLENKVNLAEVETEFRAQIETAKKYIPQLSHLTAHMGCSDATPEVRELVKKLAKEYNLIFEKKGASYGDEKWGGSDKTPAEKEVGFIKFLQSLEAGKLYYVIEHPGYDTDEMKTIGHPGYENVGIDREGVTKAWTSEKVKEIIKNKNIKLLSVKEAFGNK